MYARYVFIVATYLASFYLQLVTPSTLVAILAACVTGWAAAMIGLMPMHDARLVRACAPVCVCRGRGTCVLSCLA